VVGRGVGRRSLVRIQNAVVVGADASGQLVARKLVQHPEYGLNLLGFVDSRPARLGPPIEQVPYLGTIADLPEIVRGRDVERVIVTGQVEEESGVELVYRLRRVGAQIDVVSRVSEVLGPVVDTYELEDLTLLTIASTGPSQASLFLKRAIDLVVGAGILVLTAPLFAWIAWWVRRDGPGPVFLRQTRLGMDMREFTMLKFRTTVVDPDEGSHREYVRQIVDKRVAAAKGLSKLEREEELTPIGRWLLRTRLDELPQLINVLRGDMSLVGPRPCLPSDTDDYLPHHFERFRVPAGFTGLWQVNPGGDVSLYAALETDAVYARDRSLGLDLRLLARTPLLFVRKSAA
jgi:lipopolysaccharide/colanic/teichoic acid biosynthesis glycosyltransferase